MPNYGRYGGPENYYQGGGDGSFDPYAGRLNVGQLIQQFILRKRAEEEQAKQAQWEMQDRAWTEEQRGLQKRGAELGIEAQERAARDYQPPVPMALQNFLDYAGAKAQEQTRLREIEAQGKQARETASEAAARKATEAKAEKEAAWKDIIARSTGVLNDELNRLNDEMLVYTKEIAGSYGDPEIERSLDKYIKENNKKQQKIKNIISKLSQLKVGQEVPGYLSRAIDEYINPPEQPAPSFPGGDLSAFSFQSIAPQGGQPQATPTGMPQPAPVAAKEMAPPRPGKKKGEIATSPTGITWVWDGKKWVKR